MTSSKPTFEHNSTVRVSIEEFEYLKKCEKELYDICNNITIKELQISQSSSMHLYSVSRRISIGLFLKELDPYKSDFIFCIIFTQFIHSRIQIVGFTFHEIIIDVINMIIIYDIFYEIVYI